MHKAAVQLQVAVDMPERIVPVAVVQVGITAEHLLDDTFHVGMVVWREAGRFANPITLETG